MNNTVLKIILRKFIENFYLLFINMNTFIRRNIGKDKNAKFANLSYFTEKYENIFLKMDIEGSEYEWLLSLNKDRLNKFAQIVIECHGINDNSWGTDYNNKFECFKKLSDTHFLIHIHGNNYAGITNNIPDVVELTYIRKNCLKEEPVLNNEKLPIKNIDFPNKQNVSDYDLSFYPFVNI